MQMLADNVAQLTTSTGTGAVTLGAVNTGYRSFASAFDEGARVCYGIKSFTQWEVGFGKLVGGTLQRTTVLASSNSGALVDFASGAKTVYCTAPASSLLAGVPVELFGVRAEIGVDNTAAILAAAASGLPVVFQSGRTYEHAPMSIYTSVDWRSSANEPATLYCSTAPETSQMIFAGTEVGAVTVASGVYVMDYVIPLSSAAAVQVGDLLRFKGDVLWQSDNRGVTYEGQLAKVASISGNSVYLEATLAVGLAAGSEVTIYRPISVLLTGLRFSRAKFNGSSRGVLVQAADAPKIKDCEFQDSTRIGLHLHRCYQANVAGGKVAGSNLVVSAQLGYGILLEEAWANEVRGVVFRECRRGLDISGSSGIPSWYCSVSGNWFYGGGKAEDGSTDLWPIGAEGGSGCGSHGGADGSVYDGNFFVNTFRGLTIRGRNETARNNTFIGAMLTPIWASHSAGLEIAGNRYLDQAEEGIAAQPGAGAITMTRRPQCFVFVIPGEYDPDTHLTIKGNTVRNVKEALLYFDATINASFYNLVIHDNVVGISADAPGIVGILGRDDFIFPNQFSAWSNEVIAPADYTVLKYRMIYNPAVAQPEVIKLGHGQWRLFIPDDTAARVRVGIGQGQLYARMVPSSADNTPRLNAVLRYGAATMIDMGGSSGVTAAAAELTGTTGADGATSVAYSGDSVYVENRTGSARVMVLAIDGAV